MRRLMCSALLFLSADVALAQTSSGLNLDASIALNYAAHLQDTAPRTTERGGQANLKFGYDDKQFSLRGEGRLRFNDVYRSSANGKPYSNEARDAYRLSTDWREMYVSSEMAKWNVSFGLQQVVWGKADNLRVVDMVNPVDLRDFIVPDLNEYRKPVMMLRATGTVADWNTELLYLPRFTPTRFARAGSEFDIPLLDAETLQYVNLLPEQRPGKRVQDGEFGMQVSRSFEGLDVSLFLFQTWDDNPVFRQFVQNDAAGNPAPSLQAVYKRQSMAGVALANAIGNGMVLRSELAYVPNYTYMVGGASANLQNEGLVKSATLTALLGLDYAWRDWLFSVQTTDRFISGWNADYAVKKHAQSYTFSATGTTLAGKLESRLSVASFVNSMDGYWAQLKTTYKPTDHWAYTAGVDVFGGGKAQGVFGRFRDKDRIWLEMKYRF